jgi:hypothetical protein
MERDQERRVQAGEGGQPVLDELPDGRTFSDIDLLVEPGNVGRASKVLEARGYTPQFVLSPAWQASMASSFAG